MAIALQLTAERLRALLRAHEIELYNLDKKLGRRGGNPAKRARQQAHRPTLLLLIDRDRKALERRSRQAGLYEWR